MTTKIALFVSFAAAVTVTLLMWIAGYDWLATLGTAAGHARKTAEQARNAAGRPSSQRQMSLNGSGLIAV
jgi:hypothetical protein